MRLWNRVLAVALAVCLVLSNVPAGVVAAEAETPQQSETTDGVPSGEVINQVSSGEAPSGEVPSGKVPSGEVPSGEVPSDEVPSDEVPSGEVPSGEVPSGEVPSDEVPSDEVPSDEVPSDEVPSGEVPSDEVPSNEVPSDEVPSNEVPSDEGIGEPQPEENVKPAVYDSWSWVDPEGQLNENGQLVLEWVSEEAQMNIEAVKAMLPGAISLGDGKTVSIAKWECPEYIADETGIWPASGEFLFQATLSEEISFSEAAPKQEVKVILTEAPVPAEADSVPTVMSLTMERAWTGPMPGGFSGGIDVGGTACGVSGEFNGDEGKTNAFDGDITTKWCVGGDSGWIVFQVPSCIPKGINVFHAESGTVDEPSSYNTIAFELQVLSDPSKGYADNSEWTTILTVDNSAQKAVTHNEINGISGYHTYYRLNVTDGSKCSYDAVRIHEIDLYGAPEQITPTVDMFTVTENEVIYDGNEHTPVVEVNSDIVGMGKVTVNTKGRVVNDSTETIQISVAESIYNTAAELEIDVPFTIKKADPAADMFTVTNNIVTYDGNEHTPAVGVNPDIVGMGEVTVNTKGRAVNDSTETVQISVTAGDNYNGINGLFIQEAFTIKKATPTADLFTADNLSVEYNGEEQAPTVKVNDGITGMGEVTVSTKGTDVAHSTESVVFSVAEGANYLAAQDLELTNTAFTIRPRVVLNPTIELSKSKFDYNGLAQKPVVTVKDGSKIIPDSEYTVSYQDQDVVNAGKVTLTIVDKENGNYTVSGEAAYEIVNGFIPAENKEFTRSDAGRTWVNEDVVFTAEAGYQLSLKGEATEALWSDTLTFTQQGENQSVKFYVKDAEGRISQMVELTYNLDKVVPNQVDVEWKSNVLMRMLTFAGFDKITNQEQQLKLTLNDALSGIDSAKTQYYDTNQELNQTELDALDAAAWKDYDPGVVLQPKDGEKLIVYVKAVDKAGNVAYGCTEHGVVFDLTDPTITGVESGRIYFTTQKVIAEDVNLETVEKWAGSTCDALTVLADGTAEGILSPVTAITTYTIKAWDKAGNLTSCEIEMHPLEEALTPPAGSDGKTATEDTVTSAQKDALTDQKALMEELADKSLNPNLTTEEVDRIAEALILNGKLLQKIEDIQKAIDDNQKVIDDLAADSVKSSDKTAVENAKTALEELKAGDNLTEKEKAGVQEKIEAAETLLRKIEETKKTMDDNRKVVEDILLDQVTSHDKTALENAKKALEDLAAGDNLTEEEKTEARKIIEQAQKRLDLIADIADQIQKNTEALEGYKPETVKSTDKTAIEAPVKALNGLLEGEHLTAAEREALETVKAQGDAFLKRIQDAADAADTQAIRNVEKIDRNNVQLNQKKALQDAKKDLEHALEVYNDNYTEDELKAVKEDLDRVTKALRSIERAENVIWLISQLPSKVKEGDNRTMRNIEAAKIHYDNLTAHEQSLVGSYNYQILKNLYNQFEHYAITPLAQKEDSKNVVFQVSGPFDEFVGLRIGDAQLTEDDFIARAVKGPNGKEITEIELKESYLNTQNWRRYTIEVDYNNGIAMGSMQSGKVSSIWIPRTGDSFNMALWCTVLAVSAVGIAAAVYVLLKKKRETK